MQEWVAVGADINGDADPAGGYETKVVTDRREIDSMAGEWDLIANRLAAPPFMRPDWFAAWRQAFGGRKPVLPTGVARWARRTYGPPLAAKLHGLRARASG